MNRYLSINQLIAIKEYNKISDFSPNVLVVMFLMIFLNYEIVNHKDGYVSKNSFDTNQIESVWKHIRRTFKTHIKVAKHHIHLYAKESAYKFNKIPSFETVMLCLIQKCGEKSVDRIFSALMSLNENST